MAKRNVRIIHREVQDFVTTTGLSLSSEQRPNWQWAANATAPRTPFVLHCPSGSASRTVPFASGFPNVNRYRTLHQVDGTKWPTKTH